MRNPLDLWRNDVWPVTTLQKELERVFSEFGSGREATLPEARKFNPACNVEETQTEFLFSFDLPGVNKNDVKIDISDNRLMVSGERHEERKEDKKDHHLYERFEGKFSRSFTLPMNIASERATADFHNGVLKVTLPKKESAKSRQIKIGDAKQL